MPADPYPMSRIPAPGFDNERMVLLQRRRGVQDEMWGRALRRSPDVPAGCLRIARSLDLGPVAMGEPVFTMLVPMDTGAEGNLLSSPLHLEAVHNRWVGVLPLWTDFEGDAPSSLTMCTEAPQRVQAVPSFAAGWAATHRRIERDVAFVEGLGFDDFEVDEPEVAQYTATDLLAAGAIEHLGQWLTVAHGILDRSSRAMRKRLVPA